MVKEKWGKKSSSWQKVHYSVCQSFPSAARQISTVALSSLNNDDSIVLGDHCIPQLNDTKVINTFSSQSPFYQFSERIRFIHLCSQMGKYIPVSGAILSPISLNILTHQYIISSIFRNCLQKTKTTHKAMDRLCESPWLQTINSISDTAEQHGYKLCFSVSPSFILFWCFVFFSGLLDAHIEVALLVTMLPHTPVPVTGLWSSAPNTSLPVRTLKCTTGLPDKTRGAFICRRFSPPFSFSTLAFHISLHHSLRALWSAALLPLCTVVELSRDCNSAVEFRSKSQGFWEWLLKVTISVTHIGNVWAGGLGNIKRVLCIFLWNWSSARLVMSWYAFLSTQVK